MEEKNEPIWNQLQQVRITKDHLHLIQILMALRPEYESIRAALLHRDPLPSFGAAVKEILFEEIRLELVKPLSTSSDLALAFTPSRLKFGSSFCRNCKGTGHTFANCPTIECRYCHKRGHIVLNCPTLRPRPKSISKSICKTNSSVVVAIFDGSPSSPTMPLSEIETLLKQVISPKATALFVTPDRDLPVVICHITQASRVDIEDNRVTDNRLKMNFELTSFLDGDIETAVQSCAEMEQKELLEELAESVGAATG